jgi:UDP:flavonoid glycosyltransferase YjiC (YdhE family)
MTGGAGGGGRRGRGGWVTGLTSGLATGHEETPSSEHAQPEDAPGPRPETRRRRYVLCTTPALGHTAPLLALARRLVGEGHDVVFFTTPHYFERVVATGASFVPFAGEYDAHDLMVANLEREPSSKRGVRGVKDDLRRIFIGPIPGQYRDLRAILAEAPVDAVVVDTMFLGALPLALGPRDERPVLACVGVMPYGALSRDTAPFGFAFQPGSGRLARARNVALNWIVEHGALADIQRFARHRMAEAGVAERGRFPGYFIDLQSRVVDAYLQATVAGFEYPRSDLAPWVRFVGPILGTPTTDFEEPPWWGDLGGGKPVVHVTQGTLDNADLDRLLLLTVRALGHDDVLVVATTGGPDPEPLRRGLPPNARLERFIPHDRLLPHVDVMVTNGGYGGVQQALANGVPLVVAGDSEDKPEVAARVQWSGAGVNLHTGRPSPAMVAHVVRRVLERRSYFLRARALQAQIAASDPLGDISDTLSELCAARDQTRLTPVG